ncbi:DUF1772 domain-containing protein [Nocardia sp. NBC_00416]|uniref:DUF1772 domain-containing protein n=1 Tax=Nocardia sp. NBC_00416 TaxID=2975991 RepID=UPI002E1B86DC
MTPLLDAPRPDADGNPGPTWFTAALRLAARLFAGLFAGFLLGVLVLESSLRSVDAPTYAQVRAVELDRLDVLASVTLLPALFLCAGLAVAGYRSGRSWLPAAVAATLLAATALISFSVNLPINADQADWAAGRLPADWSEIRDRWQAAHLVRTVTAVAAFGVLLLPRRPHTRGH